jgi:hypothetical protein
MTDCPYDQALDVAADLLRDGADSEYHRGIVELLADMYATSGVYMADRKDEIEKELRERMNR